MVTPTIIIIVFRRSRRIYHAYTHDRSLFSVRSPGVCVWPTKDIFMTLLFTPADHRLCIFIAANLLSLTLPLAFYVLYALLRTTAFVPLSPSSSAASSPPTARGDTRRRQQQPASRSHRPLLIGLGRALMLLLRAVTRLLVIYHPLYPVSRRLCCLCGVCVRL